MSCESRPAKNWQSQKLTRPTMVFDHETKEYRYQVKWERPDIQEQSIEQETEKIIFTSLESLPQAAK